ncbi:MAG: DUF4349 domain-containing protein [Nitrososphaerales archaeon]
MLRETRFSKRLAIYLFVFIIGAGAVVGIYQIYSAQNSNSVQSLGLAPSTMPLGQLNGTNGGPAVFAGNSNYPYGAETIVTMSASTTSPSTQVIVPNNQPDNTQSSSAQSSTTGPQVNQSNSGFLEFFSNVTLEVDSPASSLKSVTALAYSLGGYIAYSYEQNTSALAVMRVPAGNYQSALNEIESLGNVSYSSSTSNDVSVKYTDMNATLQSLITEQGALIRLLNQSASVNQTLVIESQIQGVDAQINSIQSGILQTRTLIDYSTITVSLNVAQKPPPPPKPLALKVTATPTSGQSPLSVTFNAIVTGGVEPYLVNYNFGDGTSAQGQALIHDFVGAQVYNVTVSVTDQSGNVSTQYLLITVTTPNTHIGFSGFVNTITTLFVSVIEGIVEVAVVVLPLAAVAALIIIPYRYRTRIGGGKKAVKEADVNPNPT